MCDPPRIHPSLPEHTALFQQLYATLRESTPPSQNIPPFSTNLYVRPSQNHQLLKRGVYSGREGYILGVSHIVVEKGGIFWEGGVDSGSRIHFT